MSPAQIFQVLEDATLRGRSVCVKGYTSQDGTTKDIEFWPRPDSFYGDLILETREWLSKLSCADDEFILQTFGAEPVAVRTAACIMLEQQDAKKPASVRDQGDPIGANIITRAGSEAVWVRNIERVTPLPFTQVQGKTAEDITIRMLKQRWPLARYGLSLKLLNNYTSISVQ